MIRKDPGRKVAGKWKVTGETGTRRLLAQSRMGNGELELADLAQQTALKNSQVAWSTGLSKIHSRCSARPAAAPNRTKKNMCAMTRVGALAQVGALLVGIGIGIGIATAPVGEGATSPIHLHHNQL